ncbi:EamA family transporter [Kribbella sp. NPDC004536]|uniref:EamA family transporter n=1 Tax=Kribbella sp. NPDC004536 TaxID=3364106 RepID=UPI0036B322D1
MHQRVSTRRALALVVLAALAWGTGGPTGALLQDAGLTPLSTSFWRLAAAAAWLALVRLARRTRTPIRPRPRDVFTGVGLAICQLGYFTAIPLVGVGIATVISLGTAPLIITLATRERPTSATAAALVGLTLLTATTGSTNLVGIAAAVASAAGYSLTTLLNRNTQDPQTTALLGFVAGALFLAPFATLPTTTTGWLLVAYFGLVPTALAYTLFYEGLRTLKPSTAAVIALLEPVIATAIGILFFKEHLTAVAICGAVILLAAVAAQSRHT